MQQPHARVSCTVYTPADTQTYHVSWCYSKPLTLAFAHVLSRHYARKESVLPNVYVSLPVDVILAQCAATRLQHAHTLMETHHHHAGIAPHSIHIRTVRLHAHLHNNKVYVAQTMLPLVILPTRLDVVLQA